MRIRLPIFIVTLLFLFLPKHIVNAESNYVLPYPSEMPGSKLYKAFVLWDELMAYWYFGSLSQFTYNLEQSDKYLVEAKTLFEYKQYLLAESALEKSDEYFSQAKRALDEASKEGKDIKNTKALFREAAKKHIEVLEVTKIEAPEAFTWQPEKIQPSILQIGKDLTESIQIRQSCL